MLWAYIWDMGDTRWPEQILTWSPEERNKKKKEKKKKEKEKKKKEKKKKTQNYLGKRIWKSDEAA